jgi:tRNA-2-methylthio-N6-dimethylallyladenosine synthase
MRGLSSNSYLVFLLRFVYMNPVASIQIPDHSTDLASSVSLAYGQNHLIDTKKSPLFYIKTFGCQMNYADSEKVHMLLLQSGLQKTLSPLEADIIIANTCSVRQKGEDKVIGFIDELRRQEKKRTKKKSVVLVTGCMVKKTGLDSKYIPALEGDDTITPKSKRPTRITKITEDERGIFNSDDRLLGYEGRVDGVFRIEELSSAPKLLSIILGTTIGHDAKYDDYLRATQKRDNPSSASIIIQTGCDCYCTFCVVPYTRGRETSRPMSDIIVEIQQAVASGAKEVTLLGQNVNSYGKTQSSRGWNATTMKWELSATNTPFYDLLTAASSVPGLERIRFTSSNPHDMTPDILQAYHTLPCMCPYLHFALQSGNNEVLARMNRRHTYEDFRDKVFALRAQNPLFAVSTDIIVGFPGETRQQFEDTVQAFEECEFDFAYIARYSPRLGTYAGKNLPDDVSPAEKATRWNTLNTLLFKTYSARADMLIGSVQGVLISGVSKEGEPYGRTLHFKEVFLPAECKAKIGDMVNVRITHRDRWILRGEYV